MPEIWENPFANAILKIERANKHIADIEQRLLASENTYNISLGIHADTGEQFLYYSLADKYIRASLALMIGDAIHNLHCALDMAWREVVKRVSPAGFDASRSKFPVCKSRHELESALVRTVKLDSTSALYRFMVDAVKSYKGGDSDIWAVHQLDIHDKHHLLIPVLNVLSINGVELEHENGQVDCLTLALKGPIPGRIKTPIGSKLKNYGRATFEVKFRDGIPGEGLEVVPALRRFSAKIKEIVFRLRRHTSLSKMRA